MTSDYSDVLRAYVMRAIADRPCGAVEVTPSKYWLEFARNFRYVYNLCDEELRRIRFHTYHLTSDSYLTYYFAEEAFKELLVRGYRYFTNWTRADDLCEGEYGIGVDTQYGRISHDLLRYLGVVSDLATARLFDRDRPKAVVEIGGGYGGLARIHLLYNPGTTYCICDLEETLFFSAAYLAEQLGPQRVHLVEDALTIGDIEAGHVYIVPQSKISLIESLHFDYAISQQSLQEMTHKQVEYYLRWARKHADYLYSCNIYDHGILARTKRLVLNLPELIESYYSTPVWRGLTPATDQRFGDNHLHRAVYRCQ